MTFTEVGKSTSKNHLAKGLEDMVGKILKRSYKNTAQAPLDAIPIFHILISAFSGIA